MPKDDVNLHPEWSEEDSKIELTSEQEWEPPLEARMMLAKMIHRASWDQAVEEESRRDLRWADIPQVAGDFYGKADDATVQVGEVGALDAMVGTDGADVTFREKKEPDRDDPAPTA